MKIHGPANLRFWSLVLLLSLARRAGSACLPTSPLTLQVQSPAQAQVPSVPPTHGLTLADVLARAGQYVLRFEQDFPAVVAEEHYRQELVRADPVIHNFGWTEPDDGRVPTK